MRAPRGRRDAEPDERRTGREHAFSNNRIGECRCTGAFALRANVANVANVANLGADGEASTGADSGSGGGGP